MSLVKMYIDKELKKDTQQMKKKTRVAILTSDNADIKSEGTESSVYIEKRSKSTKIYNNYSDTYLEHPSTCSKHY